MRNRPCSAAPRVFPTGRGLTCLRASCTAWRSAKPDPFSSSLQSLTARAAPSAWRPYPPWDLKQTPRSRPPSPSSLQDDTERACRLRRWHDRSPYASDRVVIATTPWIRTDTRELSEAAELLVLDDKPAPRADNPDGFPDRRSAAQTDVRDTTQLLPERSESSPSRGGSRAHRPPRRISAAAPG